MRKCCVFDRALGKVPLGPPSTATKLALPARCVAIGSTSAAPKPIAMDMIRSQTLHKHASGVHTRGKEGVPSSLALGSRRAARALAWAGVMAGGSTKMVFADMVTGEALGGVTRPRRGGGASGRLGAAHHGREGGRGEGPTGIDAIDRPTPNPIPDPNLKPDPVPAPRAVLLGKQPSLPQLWRTKNTHKRPCFL